MKEPKLVYIQKLPLLKTAQVHTTSPINKGYIWIMECPPVYRNYKDDILMTHED